MASNKPAGFSNQFDGLVNQLIAKGALAGKPSSVVRTDLRYAEGKDVHFHFRRMTPAKFAEYRESLLWLAYLTGMQNNDFDWKFAAFEIELGGPRKGRETEPLVRSFTANSNPDVDFMVFGPDKGYDRDLPHGANLSDRADQIIDIPLRYRDEVDKQVPYVVLSMTVSFRNKWEDAERVLAIAEAEARRLRRKAGLEKVGQKPPEAPKEIK